MVKTTLGERSFMRRFLLLFLVNTIIIPFCGNPGLKATPLASTVSSVPVQTASHNQSLAGPEITGITTNTNVVPRYERLEITFQVSTLAGNLQMPYDESPPAGIQPGQGISVDALFTPDNWQTTYTQPAFYYQEFDDQVVNDREWFYPTGNFAWKVRFSPHRAGSWQFKILARDAGGSSESPALAFEVSPSSSKGFIRVSQDDPRYFEFEDGSYFPALGYNMNFDHVSWDNPVLENQANFQSMSQNGIQLVRIWLSQWGIYDASWNPWNGIDPQMHGQYIPFTELDMQTAYPGSDVSMRIASYYNPCMFLGFMKAPPAVKENTTYRVRIRYLTEDMGGPRVAGQPYGFVAKTGGWLWGDGNDCQEPGTGTVVTAYQPGDSSGWQILEGSLTTGSSSFLPFFYLVVENVTSGTAYVDYAWIEEDLGNGQYGPNIVSAPWMAHHQYMEQRNSYAFDKVVELAGEYGVYLRPVIMEKNSHIFTRIDFEGNPIPYDPGCNDQDPGNDPAECPGNDWFYGNWRQMTKVRWLQQAWWRYLQARWGYSTNIHSWELLNEGDPWNGRHYTLADEFGKYMHQFEPDKHLVSTSTWHSFPRDDFWANPEFPDVDFADLHRYIPADDPNFNDSAQATYDPSITYGALQPGGAGKPILRGETGFVDSGSEPPTDILLQDTDGIWLHNFIWAGINAGGMIESYWYENIHIYRYNQDGSLNFDHRPQYGIYYNFIKDIPLNNGEYQDAAADVSDPGLRTWGQKDVVNGRLHLWVQNSAHTWRNVVDGAPIQPISGEVQVSGFQPGINLTVEWWNTYTGSLIRRSSVQSDATGSLDLAIDQLTTDVAVKVYPLLRLDNKLFLPQVTMYQVSTQ